MNLHWRFSTTMASLGSVNFVLTAWHVNIASKCCLVTRGQTRRFSITSPALYSYWSSTMSPFTSHRTTGSGWPPTVLHVNVMSSPSRWGPTVPFSWRPHLSRMVGCSGGTETRKTGTTLGINIPSFSLLRGWGVCIKCSHNSSLHTQARKCVGVVYNPFWPA